MFFGWNERCVVGHNTNHAGYGSAELVIYLSFMVK